MELTDRSQEIISLLFKEESLRDKIHPFLDEKYFANPLHQEIVRGFLDLKEKTNKFPTAAETRYVLKTEDAKKEFDSCMTVHGDVSVDIKKEYVKEWFKGRMIIDTIGEMTDGLEDKDPGFILPYLDKLREICAFDFDDSVGLDFAASAERMFGYMHDDSKVVKSGIDAIDKELKGGWHEKTLSLLIAPTNVGKTLCKCSFAANAFLAGKNVLYVTMEMSEEEISKRLFVNVANISMDELESMTREELRKGYSSIIGKSNRLFVKEYPTGGANTNTLRNLLKELKVKQNFVPDVMFVDYMGIMQPNRHTPGDNTNTKYKTISIELRGLAVEQKLAIVSSNQANRGGFGKAELDLTDTADSIAQTNTADVIMTIGQDNEMRDSGKYNFITSKNRFNRRGKVIQLNVDFSRMKVFEIGDDEKIDRSLATMKTLAKKTEKENLETTKKFAGLK